MQIEHQTGNSKGEFFVASSNERLASMTYSMAGTQLMIIDHTEVSDALRGQGAGKQLVKAAVDYARQNKLRILPLCPFAKSVFDRTPEWHDVLDS
jgi:predicted GNAT family acetyltransferase